MQNSRWRWRHARALAWRAVLVALALSVLGPTLAGRGGVQVLDRATAQRLFALHLHGVPGEAEYVHVHQAPAPFVPDHCHAPLSGEGTHTADEVQAAALASSALCTAAQRWLGAPSATRVTSSPAERAAAAYGPPPPFIPPRG